MRETDYRFADRKRLSLAELVAEGGPMDERKAMGIARALCSRLSDETGVADADLTAFHPNTILLSSEGTISFSGDPVPDQAREAYLPPEYEKGSAARESVLIYGLGMLLLFLVTGQENRSGLDALVKNRTLKTVINRCTALDARRRFQSLTEVRSYLNRELVFPRRRMKRLALALVLLLAAGASFYVYMRGRALGEAEGETAGFRAGYRAGYDTGVRDAPGIGVEDAADPEEYGNLYGNLNSPDGAFAVAGGGDIYFALEGCAYRMDPYTGETALLVRHGELTSLSYWNGYLFYLTEDALVRLDVAAGQEETVSDRLRGRFCICDGTLYIDDEVSTGFLYGIDALTLETRQLNSDKTHDCLNVTAEKLFYTDPAKGNGLYRSDHDGGNATRLLSRVCRDVDLCGGRLYCLTADRSGGEPDILVSMDPALGEVEVLTSRPVSRFVAVNSGVFYITASSGALEWTSPDGRTRFTICDAGVSDINLAGRWIFYRLDGDDELCRMRIDGSDSQGLSQIAE